MEQNSRTDTVCSYIGTNKPLTDSFEIWPKIIDIYEWDLRNDSNQSNNFENLPKAMETKVSRVPEISEMSESTEK